MGNKHGLPFARISGLPIVAIAAFMLMAGALFAQGQAMASGFVKSSISKAVPQDQTYQITGASDYLGKTAYFVRTSNDDELVFLDEEANGTERLNLEDSQAILQGICEAGAAQAGGHWFNASVAAQMPGLILEMNNTRRNEGKCRQYTGNTNSVCYSKEDCQKTCRSSPLCLGLAESSWDFFEAISQFNTDSRNLDSEVAQDSGDFAALEANANPENIDAYLAHVSRVIVLTSNISGSSLNIDYGFCPVPPFDMTRILVLRDKMLAEKEANGKLVACQGQAANSSASAVRIKKSLGITGVFERQTGTGNAGAPAGAAAAMGDLSGWVKKLKAAMLFKLDFISKKQAGNSP
ncbi:MAG TPA: hypothetical protein PLO51_00350 [Candidatus Micrarchaeota archaeon]|nr:hypothetical protein [Candidatus Micrarchaeota archaeon]